MNAVLEAPVVQEISVSQLERVGGLPLMLRPQLDGMKVLDWAKASAESVERILQENGALLLRGLPVHSSKQFGDILTALFGEELIEYSYRSTPRTELRGNIYTATEYHADQTIPQHNENAYANNWAMRIGFLCMQPSESGGATPIGDSRRVYEMIAPAVRERFEQHGVKYVRNYSDIDLPWSEVFQTTERADVERFCDANGIGYEWLPDNCLRTVQINPATAIHPQTGESLWFNQAHLFHVSSLDPAVRDSLVKVLGEANLPRNTYYGDGSPIEEEALAQIRAVYDATKIIFQWEKGDLLLLDNMMFTHGREPYVGERKVLVGMARPQQHPAAA
ncbi:MAG: TauD/TfdA family dioxygenase [Pseudomonadota bacterium]